ncbi:MAG TPA: acyl CoA--acetate/3-ketoacid CoA transferase subunit alpha, partial [Asanoa sp.]|nr:acyl CoA--acetate/3-ketoacid CoA transferase subunit alpha [Asanoa sp.]
FVNGVVETPNGAHFTTCEPDYGRDERFQAHYAATAADDESWQAFRTRFLDTDEAGYQREVQAWQATR